MKLFEDVPGELEPHLDLRTIPLKDPCSKERRMQMHPSYADFVKHNWKLPYLPSAIELMVAGARKSWRNRRDRLAA